MATKEQLKRARELLDLDAREVSLVDRPANLRPFLIVKRAAEDPLGEFEIDPSIVEWLEKSEGAPGAPSESIKALRAAISGGTAVSGQNTEPVDQSTPATAPEAPATTEPVAKSEPETTPAPAAAESEAPATTEPVAKSEPEAPPPAPAAAESEPDPDDQPMIVVKRDGSIHVNGATVQKAKSFGKGRTATLQNAVSALAKLLGDVDEPALKAAMAPYMDPTKKVATTKAVEPTEPVATADPTELITKAVAAALEPVTKRLDEIEKTRNPSQSVEGDGGTDTNQTQVKKSIWAGVL